MTAIQTRCSSLLLLAVILLISACASMTPESNPQPLQLKWDYTVTGTHTDSVLRYAGDPAPSGAAEFVTVTDGAGNTLFEAEMPPDKAVTVPVPADGKLFVSTRWTEGRTRQEMNLADTGAAAPSADGRITLALNPSTLLYSATTPAPAAADTNASAPAPKEITIADGRGEILYQGDFRDELEIDATDDRMICAITWSDGKTTRQEISLTDNQVFYDDWDSYVVFKWDDLARQYGLLSHRQPQFLRNLRAAFVELESGTFGDTPPTAGVVTGNDVPLLEGADEIDYRGFNLGLTFNKWKGFIPSMQFGMAWGDGDTSRELAGANSGWSYQGGDSPGSSPGLASAGGTRASLETDYERQHFSLTLSDRFKLEKASQASLDYSFFLRRSVRDYRGKVALVAFPDITSTDKQELTEYDLGLGVDLRGRHSFTNKWALSGGLGLDAIYYRGDYDGRHQYVCGLCAPSDQEFSQSTDDKDNGLTWGARLTARASYQFKTNSELYLGLDYRFQDEASVLQNRVAPGDPAPHLDTDKLDWKSLRVGFNHKY